MHTYAFLQFGKLYHRLNYCNTRLYITVLGVYGESKSQWMLYCVTTFKFVVLFSFTTLFP